MKAKRAIVFLAAAAFTGLGMMGCQDAGQDASPGLINMSGTYGLYETSGEAGELNLSSIKVEQTGDTAVIRDGSNGDIIANARITEDGYAEVQWVPEGAGTWRGKILGDHSADSTHVVTGVVDSNSPVGLSSWWALRTTSAPATDCSLYGNSGRQRICAAGLLPYDPNSGAPVPTDDAETYPGQGDPGEVVQCTSQPFSQTTVATMSSGTIVMPDESVVYPGSVIQGWGLPAGNFIASSIARSGGTLSLVGPTLNATAPYSFTVDQVTPAKVRQAINDALHAVTVEATPAAVVVDVTQASSAKEAGINLGLAFDAGFAVKLDAKLKNTTTKNHFVVQYSQIFYGVQFALPVDANTGNSAFENVFLDGANFVDVTPPEVAVGNPPVYISEVKYGRQIYLAVESSESVDSVSVAIKGAIGGGSAGITVEDATTLKNSSITLWVSGGSSDFAPIDPDNPADALYAIFSSNNVFSVTNPGVPLQLTAKYLLNNVPVATNVSANFTKIACVVIPVIPTWNFKYLKMNRGLVVLNDGAAFLNLSSKSGGSLSGNKNFTLPLLPNGQMDDKDHQISFTLSNSDCFSSNLEFWIMKNGLEEAYLSYHHGTSTCGDQLKVTMGYSNPAGGTVKVEKCSAYHGSSWSDCTDEIVLTPHQ
jgi:hypothetical protein